MPHSLYDPRYVLLRQELIRIRKAAKLTQVELAAKLGVGQSLVSKIERGESFIEVLFLIEWCKACNVRVAEVVETISSFKVDP